MDNTTCKWVAIIGIVLAVLLVMWILGSIIRCFCLGVSCFQAICCCCNCCSCCDGNRRRDAPYNASYSPGYGGQQQPVVVQNHYHTRGDMSPPQYATVTDFNDDASKPATTSYNHTNPAGYQAPQPTGLMGAHSGYQRLNDPNTIEMNSMNYNNTAYNPTHTNHYDNTYDHDNMQPYNPSSNTGYYNNRY